MKKKYIVIAIVAVVVGGLLTAKLLPQKSNLRDAEKYTNKTNVAGWVDSIDAVVSDEEDARSVVQKSFETDIFANLGTCEESVISDTTYYRFAQTYQGVPVYGRSIVVASGADGAVNGISHNYLDFSGVDVTPAISEEKAEEELLKTIGSGYTSCEGLTIYSLFEEEPVLTWQFSVEINNMSGVCFVDAKTGKLVNAISKTLNETQVGIYHDEEMTIRINTVKNADGTCSFIDEERNLSVYDAQKKTVEMALVDEKGNAYGLYDGKKKKGYFDKDGNQVWYVESSTEPGTYYITDNEDYIITENAKMTPSVGDPRVALDVVTEGSPILTNQNATLAMHYAANSYDFYKNLFGRVGFNGKNGAVRICVNDYNSGNPNNAYSVFGNTRTFTCLSFGYGLDVTAELVGHEYTHSVEQSISGMAYQGESGAIMEGLSDVFGELLEDWEKDGVLDDDCDWLHGNRNMISPGDCKGEVCFYEYCGLSCPNKKHSWLFGLKTNGYCLINVVYPDCYYGEGYAINTDSDARDHGYVHHNSTVISHAAYLMTHPELEELIPLSNEELARVLFLAIGYLPSDCDFKTFAFYVCKAAEDLGLEETKILSIKANFALVGIATPETLGAETNAENDQPQQEETQKMEKRLTGIKEYDASGNLIGETKIEYDDQGRLIRDGLEYDANGNLIWDVEGPPYGVYAPGENAGSGYVYNEKNQLVKAFGWEGGYGEENYEYDNAGRLIKTYFDYDSMKGTREYSYDSKGNLEKMVEKGTYHEDEPYVETTYYTCDSQGRVIQEQVEDGGTPLVRTYDYSYLPFVVTKSDTGSYVYEGIEIRNDIGLVLLGRTFWEPVYYADKDGYMAKVTDVDYQGKRFTYEFCYDGKAAVPIKSKITETQVAACYKEVLQDKANNTTDAISYTVYDVDKDGFNELIVKEGYDKYHIYTCENGMARLCGTELWDYPGCLREYTGNGLVVYDGGMGKYHMEYLAVYVLEDYKLNHENFIISSDESSYEEVQEKRDSYKEINDFRSADDYSLLAG